MSFNILHTKWSNGWGGQEQRIILGCRKMLELGHRVVIACQPGSGILEKAREYGIPAEEVVLREMRSLLPGRLQREQGERLPGLSRRAVMLGRCRFPAAPFWQVRFPRQ